jgi:hypothetical protein
VEFDFGDGKVPTRRDRVGTGVPGLARGIEFDNVAEGVAVGTGPVISMRTLFPRVGGKEIRA